MEISQVTDGNIEYAHGEGYISTIEVAQAIQGLACLVNDRLNPGEALCIKIRKEHNLKNIYDDLTPIPNPPARTLNENCLRCIVFAPARAKLAKRVVQLTS